MDASHVEFTGTGVEKKLGREDGRSMPIRQNI
jgi:hypothetical protein